MNFFAIAGSLQTTPVVHLPMILGALGILIIGWIAAVMLRAAVRCLTGAIRLNSRLGEVCCNKISRSKAGCRSSPSGWSLPSRLRQCSANWI